MSCITTYAGRADTCRTAPLPGRTPAPTADQNLARRNEIFRLLNAGNNALFASPLSMREIAAIFGVSAATVCDGIASARAILFAVAEATADE